MNIWRGIQLLLSGGNTGTVGGVRGFLNLGPIGSKACDGSRARVQEGTYRQVGSACQCEGAPWGRTQGKHPDLRVATR